MKRGPEPSCKAGRNPATIAGAALAFLIFVTFVGYVVDETIGTRGSPVDETDQEQSTRRTCQAVNNATISAVMLITVMCFLWIGGACLIHR